MKVSPVKLFIRFTNKQVNAFQPLPDLDGAQTKRQDFDASLEKARYNSLLQQQKDIDQNRPEMAELQLTSSCEQSPPKLHQEDSKKTNTRPNVCGSRYVTPSSTVFYMICMEDLHGCHNNIGPLWIYMFQHIVICIFPHSSSRSAN